MMQKQQNENESYSESEEKHGDQNLISKRNS